MTTYSLGNLYFQSMSLVPHLALLLHIFHMLRTTNFEVHSHAPRKSVDKHNRLHLEIC